MTAPTRTPDREAHTGCQSCARVRIFVMVAAPLIGLLAWRPAAAVALAARIPDAGVIGAGIVGAAVVVFCVRYAHWRRFTAR